MMGDRVTKAKANDKSQIEQTNAKVHLLPLMNKVITVPPKLQKQISS
jgi:hypothetical protein